MESLECIRKMDIKKIKIPIKSRKMGATGGRRYIKWSWMANLAISLLILGALLPTASEAGVRPIRKVTQRRDTNPPFPFTSYSEESDEPSVTTTGDPFDQTGDYDKNDDEVGKTSTAESPKSSKVSSEESFSTIRSQPKVTKKVKNVEVESSASVESETIVPTYYDVDSSAVETAEDELFAEGSGGEGTTYASLLSPVPTLLPSSFSSILINKTARNYSNRVGIRGLEVESRNRHNANSVLATDTRVSHSNNANTTIINGANGSLLRAARPTSSVISYNPSNYNRVVKRRKITSISGRNNNMTRNGNSDVTTTPVSYVVTISEEESTMAAEANPSQVSTNSNTSSRAIAGFSKGPSKIVTKTRPKPIIIRDHEAYFQNLSTDISTTPETATSMTLQDIIEDDTQFPTIQPGVGINVIPSPPFKVRRVKVVTMRRPALINSDMIPAQQKRNGGSGLSNIGVEFVTPPSPMNNSNISDAFSSVNSSSVRIGLLADADHQSPSAVEYDIRPSPTIRHENNGYRFQYTEPAFSSKRVYKEDFGVEKSSYGNNDGGHDSHAHFDHDDEDMDFDSTTEHYQSVEPPTGGSFSIESSMNEDHHPDLGNMQRNSPGTPKYRDYFSNVAMGGSGNDAQRDNNNHLYSNSHRDSFERDGHPQLSSGVTSVTVTVTKTVISDTPVSSLPYDHIHEQSEYNPHTPINHNHQNVQPTPALPFNNNPPASPIFQIRQDQNDSKLNLDTANVNLNLNTGPVSNSVEDTKSSSNGNSSAGVAVFTNIHHEDGHGHSIEKNGDVNSNSNNQSQNHNHHEENANENQNGTPPISPTTVISSKDIKSVYYTKVVEPHFTSSSYEFTSSNEFSYHVPDPHHHDDDEDQAHSHDHEHEVQNIIPTTIKPFWDSSVTLSNASSSQIPVIIDQQPGFSTPIDTELAPPTGATSKSNSTIQGEATAEIAATEQIFPSSGENDNVGTGPGTSIEDNSGGPGPTDSNNSTKLNGAERPEGKVTPKGSPVPNFPALYQIPIFVKMVLEIPQTLFCSHLTNFKQMIVMVYGERHTGVDENQVVIFTEPNCTSVSEKTYTSINPFDFGPTESSKPNRGRKNNTVVIKPTEKSKIPNTDKNDTSISDKDGRDVDLKTTTPKQKLVPESERKNSSTTSSILRRRRRSPQKVNLGESLILDRRSNFQEDEIRYSNSNLTVEKDENLLVYFFMNDKNGNCDQELTMAFFALWNETTNRGNGSFFEGIFYHRVIDGTGTIKIINSIQDIKAFRVNLGLLGLVVEITVKTVPLFKMRVENSLKPESILFDGTALKWAREHDWFQMWWFPSSQDVVVSKGTYKNDITLTGNARTELIPDLDPIVISGGSAAYELLQLLKAEHGLHVLEQFAKLSLFKKVVGKPPIFTEDGEKIKNPAVGFGWRLQSNKCTSCAWDNGDHSIVPEESSMAFDISEFPSVIQTIRDIRQDIPAAFVFVGVMVRFSPASDGLMAISSGRETVTVEWATPMRQDPFKTARDSLGAYQAILQAMLKKHGGRPHWGKNGLYFHSKDVISQASLNRQDFVTAMNKFDPNGIFMNKFGERVRGKSNEMDIDPRAIRCALQDYCVCESDFDCASQQHCRNDICKDSRIIRPSAVVMDQNFSNLTSILEWIGLLGL